LVHIGGGPGIVGIVVFLLLLFFAWAVVLPIWSLVPASGARHRAAAAEERLRERDKTVRAFARALMALEWKGAWRESRAILGEAPARAPAVAKPVEVPPPVVKARPAALIVEAIPAPEPAPPPPPPR